ncbi:MAG: membrane dipeptidase [Amphritea sp.]
MTQVQNSAQRSAADIFADTLVWDNHAGIYPNVKTDLTGLDHWKNAGVHFTSLNVGYDVEQWQTTLQVLAAYRAWLAAHNDAYVIAGTTADVRRARVENKLAVAFDIEGMNALGGSLEMVSLYYDLGVRQMLFAYNLNNAAGGGCHDEDIGLTDFGRDVVQEMNRVGMLIDCSHSARQTSLEAMQLSSAPVIFSHSNAKALRDHGRNIDDDQIKACAATGGVIGINGLGIFLGKNDCSSEVISDHICHVAELVGPQHVGISLDYAPEADELGDFLTSRDDYWPPGQAYDTPNIKVAEPRQYSEVCNILLHRGFRDSELEGVLGGNFLRVAEQVWK